MCLICYGILTAKMQGKYGSWIGKRSRWEFNANSGWPSTTSCKISAHIAVLKILVACTPSSRNDPRQWWCWFSLIRFMNLRVFWMAILMWIIPSLGHLHGSQGCQKANSCVFSSNSACLPRSSGCWVWGTQSSSLSGTRRLTRNFYIEVQVAGLTGSS